MATEGMALCLHFEEGKKTWSFGGPSVLGERVCACVWVGVGACMWHAWCVCVACCVCVCGMLGACMWHNGCVYVACRARVCGMLCACMWQAGCVYVA